MAGFAQDYFSAGPAPEGYEYTGEYRVPKTGEVFECGDCGYPGRPLAIVQQRTREAGHKTPGDGKGYTTAKRRILRKKSDFPPVKVTAQRHSSYIHLDFTAYEYGEDEQVDEPLTHLMQAEEAQRLADDLLAALADIESRGYVQVQFDFSSYLYTYRDPSGTLKVGDAVEAPTTRQMIPARGVVRKLGRGNWKGEVKDISARLVREEL